MRIPQSSRCFLLHHLVKSFKGIVGFGFVLNFPGFRSSVYVRNWDPWKFCSFLMELCSSSKTGKALEQRSGAAVADAVFCE